jgi:hypothetical protein
MKNIFMNLVLIGLVFWFTGNLMAQNTPPEVTRIEILPSNPTLDDDLTCDYDYFDADGDPEDVDQRTVYWKRNGTYQSQFRNQLTLPASATGDNELWEAELRVHDGTDQSEMATASVSFGTPVPNTRPEIRDMMILPNNPTPSDDLNLSYTYYDADGDPEDISKRRIYWQKNGEYTRVHIGFMTIPSSDTQNGESWRCVMYVNDGKDESGEAWADPVTIESIMYKLKIAVSPAAGGTTDPEEGVHRYEAGDDVIIEAIPAEGYRFVHWSGNVAHGVKFLTYVTMSSDQSVTANFEPIPTYTLTMQVSPQGSGTTEPSVGNHTFFEGTEINITATPANGYEFVNWTGDIADPNDPTTTLTINTDEIVTANFRTTQEVISTPIVAEGPDSGYKMQPLEFTTGGSVSNKDHDVEYQFDWDDGSLSDWGIALKSHAYSDTGIYHVKSRARCKVHTNVMSGWSMTHAVTISACSLIISINPSGAGSVIKDPDKSGYDYGDTITITATPVTGWKFTGWSGDHSGNNNPVTISVRNNMSITANFEQQTYTLTTHVTPGGTGNIIKSPNKAKYTHGEVVVCTAIANPDSFYKFNHWSGDITDTVKSISLIMDSDKNITAHFSSSVTSISDLEMYGIIPSEFALMQNYPNPFNPETIIRYQIPNSSHIKLEVFNILGERIRTLVDAEQNADFYQVVWNGKDDMGVIVPSGIYFYVLRYNNTVNYKKAIFLK